jgi:hypothetical protein
MNKAFEIASKKTKGVHVSFDLDVIDPSFAPGVSVPEFDGLTVEEAMEINKQVVKHMEKVVSYDLVEYNPLRDLERKTEQIAINLVAQILKAAEKKDKYGKIDPTQQQAEQYKVKIVPPKDEQQPEVKIAPPTELPQPTEVQQVTEQPAETPVPTQPQAIETPVPQPQQVQPTVQPELQRL